MTGPPGQRSISVDRSAGEKPTLWRHLLDTSRKADRHRRLGCRETDSPASLSRHVTARRSAPLAWLSRTTERSFVVVTTGATETGDSPLPPPRDRRALRRHQTWTTDHHGGKTTMKERRDMPAGTTGLEVTAAWSPYRRAPSSTGKPASTTGTPHECSRRVRPLWSSDPARRQGRHCGGQGRLALDRRPCQLQRVVVATGHSFPDRPASAMPADPARRDSGSPFPSLGLGGCQGRRGQIVARAASKIRSVTAPGWESIDRCDARNAWMWAWARSAIENWTAGRIT